MQLQNLFILKENIIVLNYVWHLKMKFKSKDTIKRHLNFHMIIRPPYSATRQDTFCNQIKASIIFCWLQNFLLERNYLRRKSVHWARIESNGNNLGKNISDNSFHNSVFWPFSKLLLQCTMGRRRKFWCFSLNLVDLTLGGNLLICLLF